MANDLLTVGIHDESMKWSKLSWREIASLGAVSVFAMIVTASGVFNWVG